MPESRVSAVTLSRGSTWAPQPHKAPYLFADPGNPWPDDATAQTVFYDTAGSVLATVDGTVTPTAISFEAAPAVVDAIPAGANFEIFLTTSDGKPYQIRYGKVLRREAEFMQAPPTSVAQTALKFTDTFPTLGLRSAWQPVAGITTVHDNSALSLPNGVGPKEQYLSKAQSAIRWYQPLNWDSVRVYVDLLYLDTINFASDKFTVIVCADQNFGSWLGVQFELSATIPGNNQIHFCTGNGSPLSWTYQGAAIPNAVGNGDRYQIDYSNANKTLSVFKNGANTIGSWIDSGEQVPHGPGYRYTGVSWVLEAMENGPEMSFWQAMDMFDDLG